jgi:DNA-3-methyladenine glycosylase
MAHRLPRSFYARQDTLSIASELLGMHLVHAEPGVPRSQRRIGRIVETEAYLGPEDLAAHSARGRTPRTQTMFGPPGHAYVYFIYGFWNCMNVVTSPRGVPHAVLLRALEPISGLDDKTWGPGLLCRAMHIDRTLNGVDLTGRRLWLETPPGTAGNVRIGTSARIGVAYAGSWAKRPWRFFDRDSPYVSTAATPLRRRRAEPATRVR